MKDIALEARSLAGNKFKDGYNCAEAILRAFNEILNNPLSPEGLKTASGFGGGLGHAGCMCGALTASVMVLGLLKGRLDSGQARDQIYSLAHDFHERFAKEFGATCCRTLNPYEFDSPEHLRNCLKLTGRTAKLLMEYLLEKELVEPDSLVRVDSE
jgi:C_GCAxxG_C_C family probable redox protein